MEKIRLLAGGGVLDAPLAAKPPLAPLKGEARRPTGAKRRDVCMIRFVRESDVADMLAIYGPYVKNTTYTFEYEVPRPEEFTQRVRSVTAQFPWLVWEEAGRVLGYAYGSAPFDRAAYRWCSEISVYLDPSIQGRGIGKALCTAIEALLRLQGYRVVYSLVTSENAPSLAFHRRLGYRDMCLMPRCGYKMGRWLGVIWLEKELNFVENPINFPVSIWSIVESNKKLTDILDNLSLS